MPALKSPLIAALLAGAALSAPAIAAPDDSAARVDAIFAPWSGGASPGCAIGVAKNGKPILQRAYGLADLELDVRATPASIYEAGSTSKQFAAAALLMLERDGKLSLNDDVRKYIPELPDYGKTIQLRHMVSHISGLRDWGSVAALEGWPRNSRTATNDHVLEIARRQKGLNFEPGDHYLYSNTNFNLMAIIVQRVSGQTLAEFGRKRMFEPLGMTHTQWRDDHARLVPGRAKAYDRNADGYYIDNVIEDAYGNGGLLTTVGDLLIWNEALDRNTLGISEKLATRAVLNDGKPIAYAAGIVQLEHEGLQEIAHSGATGGYRAWAARYPAQKLSIALLCNAGEVNSTEIGHRVADIFLPPAAPARPYVAKGPFPSGLYAEVRTGFPLRIAATADGITADGRALKPVSPGRWDAPGGDLIFGKDGSLSRLTREGIMVAFRKVEPVASPGAADFTGRFVSIDNPVELIVSGDGSGIAINRPGWPPLKLTPSYKDVFVSEMGLISFVRDGAGKVTGLKVSDGRAYNMAFERSGN